MLCHTTASGGGGNLARTESQNFMRRVSVRIVMFCIQICRISKCPSTVADIPVSSPKPPPSCAPAPPRRAAGGSPHRVGAVRAPAGHTCSRSAAVLTQRYTAPAPQLLSKVLPMDRNGPAAPLPHPEVLVRYFQLS